MQELLVPPRAESTSEQDKMKESEVLEECSPSAVETSDMSKVCAGLEDSE